MGCSFYQGHELKPPDRGHAPTSLLIVEGIRGTVVTEGAGYLATNPDPTGTGRTEYHIGRETLKVVHQRATTPRELDVSGRARGSVAALTGSG